METRRSLTIAKNSLANLTRLSVSVLVALLLPPFLTRRLSHEMYAAWVLILQLSAYAAVFEFGLQSAISKFVAQHHAVEDLEGSSSVISTAIVLLSVAAVCALATIEVLAWQVPIFFPQLTPSLVHEVRFGLLLMGGAIAIALPATAFASSFEGLLRNSIPMAIQITGQLLSAIVITVCVLFHQTLVAMGTGVGAVTLAMGLAQVAAWRRYLSHVKVSIATVTRGAARRILRYCAEMSVWSFAMLLISGLDTAVVGHFDFKATGYYAVAASLTNFVILTVSAIFGPLLPAASALAAVNDHGAMASLTLRATRYCGLLLLLTGLPLLLYPYPILSLWVGADYARHSAVLLQILVVANMIRLYTMPYAVIVAGNGLQRYGSVAAIVEATVNLSVSILLASRFGAIGVAFGTLVGAVFSVGLHLWYSMRHTSGAIPVSRRDFLVRGLTRAMICAIPLATFLIYCKGNPARHGPLPPALTVLLAAIMIWNVGLIDSDRKQFSSVLHNWWAARALRA